MTFMKHKKIIIAGGTGFIGQGLIKYFGKDNEMIVLSRQSGETHRNLYSEKLISEKDGFNARYVKWNGDTLEETWAKEIDGADLVINLAGKSVNCRYHRRQKQHIFDSRTTSTKAIGKAIRKAIDPPKVWINAASSTIYKNTLDRPNDEVKGIISDLKKDNMPYNLIDQLRYWKNKLIAGIVYGKDSVAYKESEIDFSVQVCKLWEKTFFEENTLLTRKIALRTAITLGEGGVITPYLNLCKFGLGGKHGSGKQMFSWVHIEDVARMIEWIFEHESAEGIYNCVAPNAVSNCLFMKSLRQVTGNKIGLPSSAFLLEVGAFMIGTETELMLKSRWALATKAMSEGFEFKYRSLDDALKNIISSLPRNQYHLF
jgi:NAD dependent epimerase/dehydratase family enzyme